MLPVIVKNLISKRGMKEQNEVTRKIIAVIKKKKKIINNTVQFNKDDQ